MKFGDVFVALRLVKHTQHRESAKWRNNFANYVRCEISYAKLAIKKRHAGILVSIVVTLCGMQMLYPIHDVENF